MTEKAPSALATANPAEDGSPHEVEVVGIEKSFAGVSAIDGVSLTIPDGAFMSLLGPSGCGKTTLLRIIAGLLEPDAGAVRLDGNDITKMRPEKRPFNIVFQRYALFPHLNVLNNVMFGLGTRNSPRTGREDRRQRALAALEMVRLESYAERRPGQLSGGQAQRVALARALVNRPRLLLLDEPLAALDRNVRNAMREELLRIHSETSCTFLLVTHDQDEALSMSDSVALMNEGVIEQLDDAEDLYQRPTSTFAAGFVGAGAFVPGTIIEAPDADRVKVEVMGRTFTCACLDSAPEDVGAAIRVLFRPEEVRIGSPSAGNIDGTVRTCAFFGSHYEVLVDIGGATLRGRHQAAIQPGDEVTIDWDDFAGVAYPAVEPNGV